MRTRVVKITRDMPEWDAVTGAARVIGAGGVVAFPTDTVYGLAAGIFSRRALGRLRRLKSRGAAEPFVVLVDDAGWVCELAARITLAHRRLMAEHWPGPVTILFEAAPGLPRHVTGGLRTVALRIPNDTLTQSLLRACGTPLAAPSANPRGGTPAVTAAEVVDAFGGRVDLVLDGGRIESSRSSTIVAVKAGKVVVLREGKAAVAGSAR